MKTKEFDLSEKIDDDSFPGMFYNGFLITEDVKEFIRLLKEEIKEREKEDPQDSKLAYTFNSWLEDVCKIIDKLAGEKLI